MNPTLPDSSSWDSFVTNHPNGHLLQLSGWGALKARYGWREQRVALAHGSEIRSGGLLLFKRTLGLTLSYVPRGPVVDWEDETLARATVQTLREQARAGGASVLKVEPDLFDTLANRALMARLGFRPSPQTVQPRSSIIVDLSKGPETALANMKSKWRYNVRLAERKGVTVREATTADLPAIAGLMRETAVRDNFDVHEADYYDSAYELLAPANLVFLLAEFEGTPLGAIVVGLAGTTGIYLWGASSNRERNRMPNHALQWAGLQWAAHRGADAYDLWGIPDALGELAASIRGGSGAPDGSGTPSDAMPVDVENLPEYGLWGVYRFKQGFGGNVMRMVGAWDMAVNPIGDAVYRAGLKALEVRRYVGASVRQYARKSSSEGEPDVPTHQVTDRSAWRATLANLPAAHVLQSWEWGAVKGQTEWVAERILLEKGAAMQFLYRQPLPYIPLRIGYVPKGPVLDWEDATLVERALAAIESHGRQRRCILVKIDPDVLESSRAGESLLRTLKRRGWLYSNEQIQFKNTGVSNLRPSDEEMLAGMKQKTRYNVRVAEKRGIRVREGTDADLENFYTLYAETGARDGFLIRPLEYYRTTWETFLQAQSEADSPTGGALLLAEHPEESAPVAGIFLMRNGETAWYFYGASSDRRRRDMPNYLLQWEAMRWAKAQGCTRYDWWGAPTTPGDPDDSMQGVWGFKEGFGAQLLEHVGAWDYPVNGPLYRAYQELLPRVLNWMRSRR